MDELTAADWTAIANALHVAAEQYTKDAKACGPRVSEDRVAIAFYRQAEDARRLAEVAEEKAAT